MSNLDDELFLDAEHDAALVSFIKMNLPSDLQEKFQEDDLYYCIDLIETYLVESGVLEGKDNEEYIDIDLEKISKYIAETAKKEEYASFDSEEIFFVVQNFFDFEEENY